MPNNPLLLILYTGYQSNTYRKDLGELHFGDEPMGSREAASEGLNSPAYLFV